MSYQPETIEEFIELRAHNRPLIAISETINVPVSTLGDWNVRHAERIHERRAALWENCEAQAELDAKSDFLRLAQRIADCEAELARRPIECMTTNQLIRLLSLSRREYFRRRNPILASLDRPRSSRGNEAQISKETSQTSETEGQGPALRSQTKEGEEPVALGLHGEAPPPQPIPEKTGNISDFPISTLAPQPLATNEKRISDFQIHAEDKGKGPVELRESQREQQITKHSHDNFYP